MSRKHPNLLRSETKSETGVDQNTYEIFRKQIIRTFMDAVEGDPVHDYFSRLIREFNNRCDQLGFGDDVKITPVDAGFSYTGNFSGIPSIGLGNENYFNNENFTGYYSSSNPNDYMTLIINYNGNTVGEHHYHNGASTVGGPLYFNSPLHLNTANYQSIIGAQLMSKESYHLLDDGQLIGFGDEGGAHFTDEDPQDRVLKMFGQGSTLISYNNDPDRTFADDEDNPPTPITCVSNDGTVPFSFTGPSLTGHWIKYEFCQLFGNMDGATATIPAGTTGCSFGAYVKVPSGDPLLYDNFGGISVRTMSNTSNNTGDSRVDVDIVQVKGRNFSQSESFLGQTGEYAVQTGTNAHHNWGYGLGFTGALDVGVPTQRIPTTYFSGSRVRAHQTKLQDDCRDWTLLSGSFAFDSGDYVSGGNNLAVQLTLFYNEAIEHLQGGFGLAGSIHFSQPFITFHT